MVLRMMAILQITNAYSGDSQYIVMDKIVCIRPGPKLHQAQFKHEITAWIDTLGVDSDGSLMTFPVFHAQGMRGILDKFPPPQ